MVPIITNLTYLHCLSELQVYEYMPVNFHTLNFIISNPQSFVYYQNFINELLVSLIILMILVILYGASVMLDDPIIPIAVLFIYYPIYLFLKSINIAFLSGLVYDNIPIIEIPLSLYAVILATMPLLIMKEMTIIWEYVNNLKRK